MDAVERLREVLAPVLAPASSDGFGAAALVAAVVGRHQGLSADQADERAFGAILASCILPSYRSSFIFNFRDILSFYYL
jgi:hypothetical protein